MSHFNTYRPARLTAIVVCATLTLFGTVACGKFRSEQPLLPAQSDHVAKIVVMPFHNLGQPDEAFLTVGMTQEITDRLGLVAALNVVSHPSIDAEVGNRPAREVAEDLGVDFILNGSVLWNKASDRGDALAVEVSLVDGADGNVVWTESFSQPLENVLAIQSNVARSVTENMGVPLSDTERRAIGALPTQNIDAYLAYLRGLLHEGSFERGEIAIAERHFAEAVALDPNFAAAHAALSESHSLTFHFRYDRSPQRLAGAIGSAHRALEIDSTLPDGHRALGYYYYWGQRNYKQALTEFGQAASSRPNDPEIMSAMGVVLRRQGRWDEAVAALQRATDLDPESDIYVLDIASTHGRMRNWSTGITLCERAISMAPEDIYPYVFHAKMIRGRDGSLEASRKILESMPPKDPGQQILYWYEQAKFERDFDAARHALANAGDEIPDPINEEDLPRLLAECEIGILEGTAGPDAPSCVEAVAYLEHESRNVNPGDPAVHAALGWAYALTGDTEKAIASGERAVEIRPITVDAMEGHSHLVRLAKIYAWSGEPFRAVKSIEKSLRTPGWISVATLRLDPDWDPIRNDPRFQEVLRIHNLAE